MSQTFKLELSQPGIQLVLNALAQLPYAQSAGLIKELEVQAQAQMAQHQSAPEEQASEPATPAKRSSKKAKVAA